MFSFQVGDVLMRIHDTSGPFTCIQEVNDILRQYPYRLVKITVARGDPQSLVNVSVTPDSAGRLASLEWGFFSSHNVISPGPICVTGHPHSWVNNLLVVGVVVTEQSHEGFRMGDILLRVHTTQGPFHGLNSVREILRSLKWRVVEVEVQRAGGQVSIQACPDSKGNLHNAQLQLMQVSGLELGTSTVVTSENSRPRLEAWLQEIGIPDATVRQFIHQVTAAGMTLENLPSLTEGDVASLGILEPELRDTVLEGMMQLTSSNDRASPVVGLPAVLQVTSASLPVTTH
eukprot:evm.model.scf_67.7 EVM.evm.TU.scf_67.7   scf_67:110680-116680(-)